jgi:hypothetical protein
MKVRRSDRCGGHPCLDSGCKESYTGCSVNARHRYLISIFSRTRNDVRHVYCIHHNWAVYSKEDSAIFFLAPVSQRHLDERRERPAQTYGWKVSTLPNIFVEIPRNSLMARWCSELISREAMAKKRVISLHGRQRDFDDTMMRYYIGTRNLCRFSGS